MKIHRLALASQLLFLAALSGCGESGSGVLGDERREVAPYTHVQLLGEATVRLDIAPNADLGELVVSGDDNLLSNVKTSVSGSTLIVDTQDIFDTDRSLVVHGNASRLDSASIAGSGDLRVDGLNQDRIDLDLEGSGNATLRGKTGRAMISVSGSGDVDARELTAEHVTIDVAGSGNVEICATESLEGDIDGSGDVTLHCKPSYVDVDEDGSGDLEER